MVELLRCILILLHILENVHVDERCYEIFIFLVRLKSIRLDLQTHCCNKKKKQQRTHWKRPLSRQWRGKSNFTNKFWLHFSFCLPSHFFFEYMTSMPTHCNSNFTRFIMDIFYRSIAISPLVHISVVDCQHRWQFRTAKNVGNPVITRRNKSKYIGKFLFISNATRVYF